MTPPCPFGGAALHHPPGMSRHTSSARRHSRLRVRVRTGRVQAHAAGWRTVKVSLNVTNYSWPDGPTQLASRLISVASAAEDGGLDTVWVNDHLLQADPGAGPRERDMLEAYDTLSFLAGTTTRIGLGAMVSAISYRAPALLIKASRPGRPLRRPRVAGRRRGLPGGGGAARAAPAAHRRALRPAGRHARPRPSHVDGPARALHRQATHGPGPAMRPRAGATRGSARPGRGRGGAPHAAAGRRVRGRVQPLRRPRRGRDAAPQAATSSGSTATMSAATTAPSRRR